MSAILMQLCRNEQRAISARSNQGNSGTYSDKSMDHLTLVTVSDTGVDIANLKMAGILDKSGQVPLDGNQICFEAYSCSDIER